MATPTANTDDNSNFVGNGDAGKSGKAQDNVLLQLLGYLFFGIIFAIFVYVPLLNTKDLTKQSVAKGVATALKRNYFAVFPILSATGIILLGWFVKYNLIARHYSFLQDPTDIKYTFKKTSDMYASKTVVNMAHSSFFHFVQTTYFLSILVNSVAIAISLYVLFSSMHIAYRRGWQIVQPYKNNPFKFTLPIKWTGTPFNWVKFLSWAAFRSIEKPEAYEASLRTMYFIILVFLSLLVRYHWLHTYDIDDVHHYIIRLLNAAEPKLAKLFVWNIRWTFVAAMFLVCASASTLLRPPHPDRLSAERQFRQIRNCRYCLYAASAILVFQTFCYSQTVNYVLSLVYGLEKNPYIEQYVGYYLIDRSVNYSLSIIATYAPCALVFHYRVWGLADRAKLTKKSKKATRKDKEEWLSSHHLNSSFGASVGRVTVVMGPMITTTATYLAKMFGVH